MGWTSTDARYYTECGKVDRKRECDALYTRENASKKFQVIKSAIKGRVYYAAVRETDKASGSTKVWAAVCLTSTKRDGGFNFGYKAMSEDVGPCEDDCPKSILALLTETESQYAQEWRERCRTKADTPKKTLASVKIGQTIIIRRGSETIRAIKMAPAYQFKTAWFMVEGGNTYIKKKQITDWELASEDAPQATETPQISTEAAEVENASAEGESPLKTYQREPKTAKCRLVPRWMAKTVLKNGATPLCFNLCEDGSFSITVELNGNVAPLAKEQFRELWPDKPPQPPEIPPAKGVSAETEGTPQSTKRTILPTSAKWPRSRATSCESFSWLHENARQLTTTKTTNHVQTDHHGGGNRGDGLRHLPDRRGGRAGKGGAAPAPENARGNQNNARRRRRMSAAGKKGAKPLN